MEGKRDWKWKVVNYFSSFTLEVNILLWVLGVSMIGSTKIMDDLLIEKTCRQELGYNETICDDLGDDEDIQDEVMEEVNNFLMISQWIGAVPTFCFSLIAGSLSDDFGRKPLILFPLFASFLKTIIELLLYLFYEDLPIECFYLLQIYEFFGGMAVYYLGIYGYGCSITTPEERATRLVRFDGFERVGFVIGPLLALIFYKYVGIGLNFGVSIFCTLAAFLYVLFVIKEPPKLVSQAEIEAKNKGKGFFHILKRYIVVPLSEMFTAVFKQRPGKLRVLLWMMLATYGLYWFCLEEFAIIYYYLLDTFDDYDGVDFALFFFIMCAGGAVASLIIIPLANDIWKVHEAMTLTIICICTVGASAFAALAKEVWQFYLAQSLRWATICVYSLSRTLVTRLIGPDEIGKVFSAMALLAALVPVAGNPSYRKLFSASQDTFPAAFFLLSVACFSLAAMLNFYFFTQRGTLGEAKNRLQAVQKQQETQEKVKE